MASKKASEFDLESVISLMVGRKIENAYPAEEAIKSALVDYYEKNEGVCGGEIKDRL